MKCKVCQKELIKKQKSTCSHKCRNVYVSSQIKGRPSPFKGMKNRFSEETKKKISDASRGRKMSIENIEKQRLRMKGISFFKGKKHKPESIAIIKEKNTGENHYNYKDGLSKDNRCEVLKRYSLTKDSYQKILDSQNGVCAICKKPEVVRKNLSVDHDHRCCTHHKSCGKCIRGLLCHRCNQALGLMNDDILILKSAVDYLSRTI